MNAKKALAGKNNKPNQNKRTITLFVIATLIIFLLIISLVFAVQTDISGVDKASITLMVDNAKKEISLDNNGNFRIVVPLLASRLGTEKEGKRYYINITKP